MAGIDSALAGMAGFEILASQDTPVHRLDPRAKTLVTLAFVVTVVSFGKYEVSAMTPLFLYPIVMAGVGEISFAFVLSKLLFVAPFALIVGVSNPIIDTDTLLHVGSLGISGGWVSYTSIIVRFLLTVSAALILLGTTGFNAICLALTRLRTPRPFALQLMLLHRYLFVLGEEAARTVRAWRLRAGTQRRISPNVYVSVIAQLLIRALERSQRIHMAMLSRAFTGDIHLTRPLRFTKADAAFLTAWLAFFCLVRAVNVPQWLGHALLGVVL